MVLYGIRNTVYTRRIHGLRMYETLWGPEHHGVLWGFEHNICTRRMIFMLDEVLELYLAFKTPHMNKDIMAHYQDSSMIK